MHLKDILRLEQVWELEGTMLSFRSAIRNYPEYWTDRQANSVDPHQSPQNAASDQGLYYLPLIH